MAFRDLIPWRREEGRLVRRGEEHPLAALHREMNRLFDGFFRGGELPFAAPWGRGGFVPSVDVRETDTAVVVTAELPGLSEEDITVELTDEGLTISGEKKTQETEEREGYTRTERSFGSFQRFVAIPVKVEEGNATAEFKRGVLTVTLPKAAEEQAKRKKIDIKTEQPEKQE